jgi:hypothetical protein
LFIVLSNGIGTLFGDPERRASNQPEKEFAMKRNLVAPLAEVAYKIFLTPSSSITEKAAQFAGCVAHQAASSHLPKSRSDAFGRLAAQKMLNLVQNSYNYSTEQAEKSAAFQEAKYEQIKAQVPWLHSATALQTQQRHFESLEIVRNRTLSDGLTLTDSASIYRSQCFKKNQIEIESSSHIYPKAFCVAFLAFERAAQTPSKQQFESLIKKALIQELAESFSYTEFFLQILKSREMGAIMGVVLFLGLILLAFPSFGLVVLSETTSYAVGGGMAFSGGAYHLWRLFSPQPKAVDEEIDTMLLPEAV